MYLIVGSFLEYIGRYVEDFLQQVFLDYSVNLTITPLFSYRVVRFLLCVYYMYIILAKIVRLRPGHIHR